MINKSPVLDQTPLNFSFALSCGVLNRFMGILNTYVNMGINPEFNQTPLASLFRVPSMCYFPLNRTSICPGHYRLIRRDLLPNLALLR